MNWNRTLRILLLALPLGLTACGDSKPEAFARQAKAGGSHDAVRGEETKPKKETVEAEEARIMLTDDAMNAAGIELATAGPATIRHVLPLYGTVRPNAERVRDVTARYPGTIRSVGKTVGDSVRQGEVLATVESNESLQTYTVTAPLTGVVTARNANPGEQAGVAPLLTVADLSTLWVELALFPRDVSKVRAGQIVRVRAADGDLAAEGRIVYVSPLGQPGSQALTARVLLDNASRRWTPGLYVTGDVVLSEATVPVALSSAAVQMIDDKPSVFVRDGKGFLPRVVTLGESDSDLVEVRSGIAIGTRYATRNSFVLKSELGKGEAEHDH